MIKQASSLSQKTFKKMIAGSKRYPPSKISKELKSAGMSHLLHSSRINKQQAMKALKYLKQKRMLPKYTEPNKILQQTAVKQYQQDLAELEAEKQKHIRARIAQELSEEAEAIEKEEDPLMKHYHPGSVLANKGKRVIDEIEQEWQKREKAIEKEEEKRKKLTNPKGVRPEKPPLVNLPDMDIG